MNDIQDTLNNRQDSYGPYANVCALTQAFMRIVNRSPNGNALSDVHVESLHMIFSKISRLLSGNSNHLDTIHDIAGYATLLYDDISKGVENGIK
jgi:hypothetical protein